MKLKTMLTMAAALAGVMLPHASHANEIDIKTAEELMDLGSDYFTSNSTVNLVSDLDFTGIDNFAPLGTLNCPFHGHFNGNGHTIHNLRLKTEQFYYIGLFGIVNEAYIYNFTLADSCHFMSDSPNIVTIGSIVAFSERGVKIAHVTNNAIVHYNGTSKFTHVGGIVGMMHSYYQNPGSIILYQCHNMGAVESSGGHTGGVVGYVSMNGTNSLIDIEQVTNNGVVLYTGNHTLAGVGGIVGKISILNSSMKSYILHSMNLGEIGIKTLENYTTASVGGILGAGDFGAEIAFSIKSCINDAHIYSKTAAIMGGISGYLYSHHERVHAYVRNCVNRGLVLLDFYTDDDNNVNTYIGGIVGYVYTTPHAAGTSDGHIHILNCLNHGDLATRYDMTYCGGIAGRLFPYAPNSTIVANCLSEGMIVPAAPATDLYNYGGIAGFAVFTSGQAMVPMILYSYYDEQNGEAVPDVSEEFLEMVSPYNGRDHELDKEIFVEGKQYFNTVSALNALTSYDTEEEIFVKWLIFIFNVNGGNYMAPKPELMHLEYISPPTPERLGAAFRGWFLDAKFEKPLNVTALEVGPHYLYAKWEVFTYNITFYNEKKQLITTESGECGTPVNFPKTKAPKGKEAQWTYENGKVFKTKSFINADIKLYLNWVDKSAADNVSPSLVLFAIISCILSLFF